MRRMCFELTVLVAVLVLAAGCSSSEEKTGPEKTSPDKSASSSASGLSDLVSPVVPLRGPPAKPEVAKEKEKEKPIAPPKTADKPVEADRYPELISPLQNEASKVKAKAVASPRPVAEEPPPSAFARFDYGPRRREGVGTRRG